MAPTKIPLFKELPLDPTHPPHSGWIWGPDDQLGTLNLITPETVALAVQEVKRGKSFGLDLPMHLSHVPVSFREQLKHEIMQIAPNTNDDRIEMNTQSSTQWDGFRHVGFQDGRHYNGCTQAEIESGKTSRIGVHEWCKKGIVGRGVLIDFVEYAKANNIEYDPLKYFVITRKQILEIAEKSNLEFRRGDVLLIRMGYTEKLASLSEEDLLAFQNVNKDPYTTSFPGVESSLEFLEWLWDTGFAAVGGDAPGFEAFPATEFGMHETLLSGFGMPIAELFQLRSLAEECMDSNRWSFLFISQPLNIEGSVASPPNALAII